MGDLLEKFIQNNREQFDVEEPENSVWESLNKDLNRRKSFDWSLLWKSAAILFMGCTIYLLIELSKQQEQISPLAEFEQVEKYYTQLINERTEQLSDFELENLQRNFAIDLNELDGLYAELKDAFGKDLKDQKIVDAMVGNLQLRLKILNRQIEILEKLNDIKDEEEFANI